MCTNATQDSEIFSEKIGVLCELSCVTLCILYSLSDFPVTVMEYSGPLDALSSRDVDQKLVNSRLEECSICVDTSVMRLVETVLSTSKTRCQRDLGKHVYMHSLHRQTVHCLLYLYLHVHVHI